MSVGEGLWSIVKHGALSVRYFSARSILPKLDEVAACSIAYADVICIVESWLDGEVRNNEISC